MLSLLLSFGRHIKINAITYILIYVPLYKVNEHMQYIYCYSMQHKHINSFTLLQSDLPECQSCSARYSVPPSCLKQHGPQNSLVDTHWYHQSKWCDTPQ